MRNQEHRIDRHGLPIVVLIPLGTHDYSFNTHVVLTLMLDRWLSIDLKSYLLQGRDALCISVPNPFYKVQPPWFSTRTENRQEERCYERLCKKILKKRSSMRVLLTSIFQGPVAYVTNTGQCGP